MGLFNKKPEIQDGLAFVPQFARVAVDNLAGNFDPLGIAWNAKYDPLTNGSEQLLLRILGTGQILAARGKDGGPPPPGRMGTPFTVAQGIVDALITDRRVVVLVQGGDTALGSVDIGSGSMLLVSTPLSNIGMVQARRDWLEFHDETHGAMMRFRDLLGVDRGTGLTDSGTDVSRVERDLTAKFADM